MSLKISEIVSFVAISLLVGALASCGNSKPERVPEGYYINFPVNIQIKLDLIILV